MYIKNEIVDSLSTIETTSSFKTPVSNQYNGELDGQIKSMMFKLDGAWAYSVCGTH